MSYPPVPFCSQISGSPAKNDCGPAACLSLARWNGRGESLSPEQLADMIGKKGKLTGSADLKAMLSKLGLTPQSGGEYPFIQLVVYNKLPVQNPVFRGQDFWHWIVRLDDTHYHDPLRTGQEGANLLGTKEQLDGAEIAKIHRVSVKERPDVEEEDMKWQAKKGSGGARVRLTPDKTGLRNIAGVLPEGHPPVDGELNGDWVKVTLKGNFTVSGVPLVPSAATTTFDGYISTAVIGPVTATQPHPPTLVRPSKLLGVNVISDHHYAQQAYDLGCRFFLWMEGYLGAVEFKQAHPDATVVYRKYLEGRRFASGRELVEACDGCRAPGLIYMGLNEGDAYGPDGADLRERARLDVEAATYLKQVNPGGIWAAGTFSMGTPDFTNEETCKTIREIYAPAYNSGLLWMDMHLYSPNPNSWMVPQDPKWPAKIGSEWFERRWDWFFTKCGFDRNIKHFIATETGLDQGGVGGFPAHNISDDQFRDYCRYWLTLQKDGPVQGAALFRLGEYGGRWGGYNVKDYLDVLQQEWAK